MTNLPCAQWLPLVALTLAVSRPLFSSTIPVSYSFTGAVTSDTVSGNSLLLTGSAEGNFNAWSGVEFDTTDNVNLTTGLDNGAFTLIFPDGDQAFGDLFEDDSQVGDTGPFTQRLTFTGGTGQFVGASGVLSGEGYVSLDGYSSSGGGTLTAPGLVVTPEPRSWLLLLTGCSLVVACVLQRRSAQMT